MAEDELDEAEDEGDIARQLLATSDDDPVEALEWISHLTEEGLPEHPLILFAKFNAHRHLATDKLYRAGLTGTAGATVDEMEPYFGPEEIDHARCALGAIAAIERVDPAYVISRGFVEDFVDRVCTALERVEPGSVQRLLGWTKLSYFGAYRIRFMGDVAKDMRQPLGGAALKSRIAIGDIFTEAVIVSVKQHSERGAYVNAMLLTRNMEEHETLGDVWLGYINLYESGPAEFIAVDDD